MNGHVIIDIETYDNLIFDNKNLKETVDLVKNMCKEKSDEIHDLHQFILDKSLCYHLLDKHKLDELTDLDCINFAILDHDNLIKLGISKDEMVRFITEKYFESKG